MLTRIHTQTHSEIPETACKKPTFKAWLRKLSKTPHNKVSSPKKKKNQSYCYTKIIQNAGTRVMGRKTYIITQASEDADKFLPLAPVWCRPWNQPSNTIGGTFENKKEQIMQNKITSDGFPCHCLSTPNITGKQKTRAWHSECSRPLYQSALLSKARALPAPNPFKNQFREIPSWFLIN